MRLRTNAEETAKVAKQKGPSLKSEQPQSEDERNLQSRSSLYLIYKLTNKLQAPFSTYLQHRYKITFNEFRMIMMMGQYPSAASHQLADLTGVTPMSVSRAVTALEKHGWIEVRRDETNGRRKVLSLTSEGDRLYVAMLGATDLVATYLLSEFKSDEILAFNNTLERLIDTLEKTDSGGKSLFLEATRPMIEGDFR